MGKRRSKSFDRRTPPRRANRINREIRASEVRVVGVSDERDGVYTTQEALAIAEEMEMDLVEVAPTAKPPVCRVVEYSKFRYEQKKREKAQKAKQHVVVMKEIRFGPNTDEHDFNFKLRHAEKFLTEGNKLKTYVQFRGRNIIYKDRGRDILDRFADALNELGKIETAPRMDGKRMVMIIAPRKVANKA